MLQNLGKDGKIADLVAAEIYPPALLSADSSVTVLGVFVLESADKFLGRVLAREIMIITFDAAAFREFGGDGDDPGSGAWFIL